MLNNDRIIHLILFGMMFLMILALAILSVWVESYRTLAGSLVFAWMSAIGLYINPAKKDGPVIQPSRIQPITTAEKPNA